MSKLATRKQQLTEPEQKAVKAFRGNPITAYKRAYPAMAKRLRPETLEKKAHAFFNQAKIQAALKAAKKPTKIRAAGTRKPKKPPKGQKRPVGRPSVFDDEVMSIAHAYVRDFEQYGHVIPTQEGLAALLGVSEHTLRAWAREPGKKEFSTVLERLRTSQKVMLVNGSLKGDLNPTIAKMMLLSKHGYTERQTIEHTGKGGGPIQTETKSITTDMSQEEASALYREMLGDPNG